MYSSCLMMAAPVPYDTLLPDLGDWLWNSRIIMSISGIRNLDYIDLNDDFHSVKDIPWWIIPLLVKNVRSTTTMNDINEWLKILRPMLQQ